MRSSKVKDLGRIFLSAALSFPCLVFAAPKVFKVGVLLSETGELKDSGGEMRRAVDLAVKDFNAKHAARAKMEAVFLDDESKVESASQKAELLLKTHKVQAVVGPSFLAGAAVAAPLLEAANVPVVLPLSRTANWGAGKNTRFLQVEASRLGQVLAGFAHETLKAKSVALIDESTSDASKNFNDGFARHLAQKGVKVVGRLAYVSAKDEAPKLLSELSKLKADVVVLPSASWESARAFLDPAASSGVPAIFLGSNTWGKGLLAAKGPSPIGHFFAEMFSVSDPASRAFVESFRKAYDVDPSTLSALSYEAVSILGQAYQRAGFQGEVPLQKVLRAPLDFLGVAGKIRFESDSTPRRQVIVLETTQSGIPRFRQALPLR
jgi:branched-chain amino acid transport system substrate-binding protein